jgi:hypothetical protein
MNRARLLFAATLGALALGAGVSAAQSTPAAPPMTSVLAGKKLTPPARGEVVVEYTKPVTKPLKKGGEDLVVTTFQVKNPGLSPIARLSIIETWFDKASQQVGGGKGTIDGLLQPGEVKTITIESVYKPSFNGDSFNFTHANGTVRPKQVAKLTPGTGTAAPAAGAKPATAAAKPAAAPAKK